MYFPNSKKVFWNYLILLVYLIFIKLIKKFLILKR